MKEERTSSKQKIVFMGTPHIATYALQALLDLKQEIVAVVTQPDKEVGRKKELTYSPIKQLALANNLFIFQPNKIGEIYDDLKKLNFDYILTCAYGQFIPDDILLLPKKNSVNIHASLLPKYRGGAPIHWAIINGDKETGISLIKMVKKMDAGEIYFQEKISISETETTKSLFDKMGNLIYNFLISKWSKFIRNEFTIKVQDENKVTFGLNIQREQEKIDWNNKSDFILNLIKGLFDKPFACSFYNSIEIKIIKANKTNNSSLNFEPGTIVSISKLGLEVTTKDYNILITEIKVSGKKAMTIKEMLNGNNIFLVNSKFM